MHTECPHCQTLFNVSAQQLRVAHGTVRCGHCMHTFDALEALSEGDGEVERTNPDSTGSETSSPSVEEHGDRQLLRSPPGGTRWTLADSDLADTVSQTGAADAESGSDVELIQAGPMLDNQLVSDMDAGLEADEQPLGDVADVIEDESPEALAALEGIVPAYTADELPPDEPPDTPHTDADELDHVAVQAGEDTAAEEPEYPQVLEEDIGRIKNARRNRRRKLTYTVLSIFLLSTLGVQYLVLMPEDALRRYPMSRPLVERLCDLRDSCSLLIQREPGLVEVTSRDVRVHPRYEGALQVTASLVNSAGFVQPYPRVQFTLFNVNGQTIAARIFEPHEYLSAETNISTGMEPSTPIRVELHMLAPDEAAVSFEFKFL